MFETLSNGLCVIVACAWQAHSRVHPGAPSSMHIHVTVHSGSHQGSSTLHPQVLFLIWGTRLALRSPCLWGASFRTCVLCPPELARVSPQRHSRESEEGQDSHRALKAGLHELASYLPGCGRPDGQAWPNVTLRPDFSCFHLFSQGDFCVNYGDRGLSWSPTGHLSFAERATELPSGVQRFGGYSQECGLPQNGSSHPATLPRKARWHSLSQGSPQGTVSPCIPAKRTTLTSRQTGAGTKAAGKLLSRILRSLKPGPSEEGQSTVV